MLSNLVDLYPVNEFSTALGISVQVQNCALVFLVALDCFFISNLYFAWCSSIIMRVFSSIIIIIPLLLFFASVSGKPVKSVAVATIRGDDGNDFAVRTPSPPLIPEKEHRPVADETAVVEEGLKVEEKPVIEEKPVTEIVPEATTTTVKIPRGPIGQVPPSTSKPPPSRGCALPLNPIQESVHLVGYRFGTHHESRLEFNTTRGKYKNDFDFRFEFRTKETEGILFYVSDSKDHKHYAAVYLMSGHVVFTFKGDHDAVLIESDETYNDDNWHLLEFNRQGVNGKLSVDELDINSSENPVGKTLSLDLHIPFYVGGLNPDHYNAVQSNLNTTTSFIGCIRSMSMNNKLLEQSAEYGVIPCSDNVEVGTFFGGDTQSYMQLKDKFKVGEVFSIKMDIKPRTFSGVLVSAHGRKDYYVLELVNGTLRLFVENGKGEVTASFYPPNNNAFHLCDGEWHTIQAIKSRNVVTLSVDNIFTEPRVGPTYSMSTDTGSALYLGGHRYIKKVRGIHSRVPFTGCIKNVELYNEPFELLPHMIHGDITIGFCPNN